MAGAFDICVVHAEPLITVAGVASGDVEGHGRWSFATDGCVTTARLEWQIRPTPISMRLLAQVAPPLVKWNHEGVMRRGGEALARKLNARLVSIAHH